MTFKSLPFNIFIELSLCAVIFFFLGNDASASTKSWMPPPPDTVDLVLECGEDSLTICANLDDIGGTLASVFACSSPANGNLTIKNDTCFYYYPNSGFEGEDEACIVICNDANECDTFHFEILVESCVQQIPCVDVPYDIFTAYLTDCNDQLKICNSFPLGEALLYDFTINGAPYNGNLSVCSFDTLYSYSLGSLPDGGLTGPYELVSWEVDGETFSGQFDDIEELIDLLNMFDPNGNWQFDQSTSNAFSFNTLANYGQMTITQIATNDMAILSRNSTTAPVGSSIYLPAGINEVILSHQNVDYCVDTFTTVVHCAPYRTFRDTILIQETKDLCLSDNSIPGSLQNVESKCFNCQSINVSLNGDCTSYTGIATGTDSLLVTGCDEYGLCDSTLLLVTVKDESQVPNAVIDYDTTNENTLLPLDLLGNDDLNGELKSIFIIIFPQHGDVVINTDFEITYQPDTDFCGMDAFAYEICNENGCDTSTATILVRCKSPLVYNGFSPNDDGINDTFSIFNIEDFPSNHLRVYNRWGNLIFEKKDYRNEWDGRSLQNDILPDGTYFYLFEAENQVTMKGYVQIHR
ncbi:MAG: gliding motility-associated C-terminal domain-containing protein [Bacteroidota bacterium]